jgi:beta-galactosidase/beta-glucuronidase
MPGASHAAEGQRQTAAARAQSTSTTVLSLEGDGWVVAADPDNKGRDEAWWKSPRSEAKPIRVPGIFQEALPGYHGVAWYWREFVPPRNPYAVGRCLLRFHAVDYLADVWLNDVAIGGHEGGRNALCVGRHGRGEGGNAQPARRARSEPHGGADRRHRAY